VHHPEYKSIMEKWYVDEKTLHIKNYILKCNFTPRSEPKSTRCIIKTNAEKVDAGLRDETTATHVQQND